MEILTIIFVIFAMIIALYIVYKQGFFDGEKKGLAKGYQMIEKLIDDYFNKKEKK